MKVFGIGTDILEIDRVRKLWKTHGLRFARRILSDHEIQVLQTHSHPDLFLAKRFAAKEAVAKALGTGFRNAVYLTQIEIQTQESGKPSVQLLDQTKAWLEQQGDFQIEISLSDERHYAVAFAMVLFKL